MMNRCYHGRWRLPYPKMFPFAIITQVCKNNLRPKIDPHWPNSLSSLLREAWHQDPLQRPSCEQVLAKLRETEKEYNSHKDAWETLLINHQDEKKKGNTKWLRREFTSRF